MSQIIISKTFFFIFSWMILSKMKKEWKKKSNAATYFDINQLHYKSIAIWIVIFSWIKSIIYINMLFCQNFNDNRLQITNKVNFKILRFTINPINFRFSLEIFYSFVSICFLKMKIIWFFMFWRFWRQLAQNWTYTIELI